MNTKPLQFPTPYVDPTWYDGWETSKAVAMAIHAIADDKRSPEAIWEDPTDTEIDHVKMILENYVGAGVVEMPEDGRFNWGQEPVRL